MSKGLSVPVYRLAVLLPCLLALPALAQERSISDRIEKRSFPSVFQAWNGAENLPNESRDVTIARHDVYFHSVGEFGLTWDGYSKGTARKFTESSIQRARAYRRKLLGLNPDIVLLGELRYRGAKPNYLPGGKSHEWWMKDSSGNPVPSWADGPEDRTLTWQNADSWRLDLSDWGFQKSVADKAAAMVNSGVVDGVVLDWWDERDFPDARRSLIQKIRSAIGDEALIVVNTNHRRIPLAAPYVNGAYMETGWDHSPKAWNTHFEVMQWADNNLREPSMVLYESWYKYSRSDFSIMRANATLVTVAAGGYALFTEPNTVIGPDHKHDWYDFWNADLGFPRDQGNRRSDGAHERWFSKGMALYNPPDNTEVTVEFDRPMRSAATGRYARTHKVKAFDGDFFLTSSDPDPDPRPAPAPDPEQASIDAFYVPENVEPGDALTVRVPIDVTGESDLLLSLQDTSNPQSWATYGFARTRVSADGQVDVQLSVSPGAPRGTRYAVTAYLVPKGRNWSDRLTHRTVRGISVR